MHPTSCEHCASRDLHWFTPASHAGRAAVLLCKRCERLTIVPPRATRPLHASRARAHSRAQAAGARRAA